MRSLTVMLGVISLTLGMLGSGTAQADSCVDLRSGRNYDCNGPMPQADSSHAANRADPQSMRELLRKRLSSGEADPSAAQRHQRMQTALGAALAACQNGDTATFQSQLNTAGNIATTPDDRNIVKSVRDTCNALDGTHATTAKPTPSQPPPAEDRAATPAPAPPSDPNLFATCGATDSRGIQTCYEAGPSGYGCRKLLRQGGDAVWSEDQSTCDSSAILQQRNAYFARLRSQPAPPPQFGDEETRRQAAWERLSPPCKALANSMMQGADKGDREKALSSYGTLRAQCDSELRALADAVRSDLPERVLSSRARSAMAKAMSADPNRLAESTADRGYDASFDTGEVFDFALGLLNVLSGAAGMYAAMPHGAAASYSGGVFRHASSYGQGAPYHPAPRQSPSTITGLGR
jgi:hypothetical protein